MRKKTGKPWQGGSWVRQGKCGSVNVYGRGRRKVERPADATTLCSLEQHTCKTYCFFVSSRRRHTSSLCDWSSDVCSSDLEHQLLGGGGAGGQAHPLHAGHPGGVELASVGDQIARQPLFRSDLPETTGVGAVRSADHQKHLHRL